MSRLSPGRFALESGALLAVSALVLAFAWSRATGDAPAYAASGFLAMSLPAFAAGFWLTGTHGRAGGGFVLALGAGLTVRAVLLAVVVAAAARRGPDALVGALSGLAAGFEPLTIYEMIWFSRRAHRGPADAKGRA